MTLMDVATAAERLNLTQATVRRFIKRGDLACYRFGRWVRVSEEDLTDFMERRHERVQPKWERPAEPAVPITPRRHRRAS